MEFTRKLSHDWEEVPQEDLYQDGELNNQQVMLFIYNQVIVDGEWKLIREIT